MRPVLVFLFIFMLCSIPASRAAIIIKQHTAVPACASLHVSVDADTTKMNSRTRAFAEPFVHRRHKKAEGGWAGLLAYICVCTVVLAPLAVVFGALGLSRRKNYKLALRGFVYGLVYVLLAAIILTLTLF